MSPLETLRLWFAAFSEQEMEAARALWAEGATLRAPDGGFTGDFDELLGWYARRRQAEGPGFAWQVQDLLGGERYAAAVIRLVSDRRPSGWDQHAIYAVSDGRIQQVWLHES